MALNLPRQLRLDRVLPVHGPQLPFTQNFSGCSCPLLLHLLLGCDLLLFFLLFWWHAPFGGVWNLSGVGKDGQDQIDQQVDTGKGEERTERLGPVHTQLPLLFIFPHVRQEHSCSEVSFK